jgi:hypothetical protein
VESGIVGKSMEMSLERSCVEMKSYLHRIKIKIAIQKYIARNNDFWEELLASAFLYNISIVMIRM